MQTEDFLAKKKRNSAAGKELQWRRLERERERKSFYKKIGPEKKTGGKGASVAMARPAAMLPFDLGFGESFCRRYDR